MEIKSLNEDYDNELGFLVSLFEMPDNFVCTHSQHLQEGKITNDFLLSCPSTGKEQSFSFSGHYDDTLEEIWQKSETKRVTKVHLYDALSSFTGKTLPWGSLTGVRPVKFARELIKHWGVNEFTIAEVLEREYRVSTAKAKLVAQILRNQKCIIENDNLVDLYLNIPICPSRCLYCSFISHEIRAVEGQIESYIDALIKELDAVKKIISARALIVRNIYIGGGTPSVLTASQLDRLLDEIAYQVNEFTVECGRPDTITAEKLDVLQKHGVSRISINPQTFCETTLKRIGRNHKVADVLEAYSLALERGFVVNMDLIAGLPGEKLATFKKTINTTLELAPDNITIHTLSVKRGSTLKDMQTPADKDVQKMVEYGEKSMAENGYKPYYLYRQKNQLKGLENVGYFRDDKICMFNIDSMEETNSVIALGAGAISKRVYSVAHKLERGANPKFLADYISRIDEVIADKQKLFGAP